MTTSPLPSFEALSISEFSKPKVGAGRAKLTKIQLQAREWQVPLLLKLSYPNTQETINFVFIVQWQPAHHCKSDKFLSYNRKQLQTQVKCD